MKKTISILLIICTLAFCLVSCDTKDVTNNSDLNETETQETIQGCDITGLHTYKDGECTECNIKVYDILKDYLTENGEMSGFSYVITFGSYKTDSYHACIGYNTQADYIYISSRYQSTPGLSNPHIFDLELKLTPYTFEDGGFDWSASCWRLSCDCPTVRGTLDPQKFSSSTSTLEYTSYENGADKVVRNARMALQGCIENYYIDFLKSVGSNLSIGAIGFVRYEK